MKARFAVRTLLAGSSLVALMAASDVVLGANLDNNAGHTTAILSVTVGESVDRILNRGTITGGSTGIVVDGGTVAGGSGSISNAKILGGDQALIDVSGEDFAAGILVDGTPGNIAEVASGIVNLGGNINVSASTSESGLGGSTVLTAVSQDPQYNQYGHGSDDLWYVQFDGSGNAAVYNELGQFQYFTDVSTFEGYIGGTTIGRNSNPITWENVANRTYWLGTDGALYSANVGEGNYQSAINQVEIDGTGGATAYGIAVNSAGHGVSFGGSVRNTGNIEVDAVSDVSSVNIDPSLNPEVGTVASAGAQAYGVSIETDLYNGGINNSGHIDVHGTGYLNAVAFALGTNSAFANVTGDARAQASGIYFSGNLIANDVNNSGHITASANATAENTATATAQDSDAQAYVREGGAVANAAGLNVNADTLLGNIYNTGSISANANAASLNKAIATSGNSGSASANVSGSAHAYAQGLIFDIGSVNGDVLNSGSVHAGAVANISNSALADATGGLGSNSAQAVAYGDAVASSTGVGTNISVLNGNLSNSGTISADATALSTNKATAKANEYAYAYASGGAYARAYGADISLGNIEGDISSSGSITANALASSINTASANVDGGDYAYAYAYGNAAAEAKGLQISAYSVGGDVSNSANINVDATAHSENTATGVANGAGNVVAYASAGNVIAGNVAGLEISLTTFNGVVSNSGNIDVTSVASATNLATAQGGLSDVEAAASADQVYAKAYGIAVFGTYLGDVTNSGNITVDSTASVNNQATANSGSQAGAYAYGGADAYASGIYLYAQSLSGDVLNTGAVSATADASVVNKATANGGNVSSGAFAGGSDVTAYATGIDISVTTLNGSLTNIGNITVDASAASNNSADASAVDHGASAIARGDVSAAATGLYVGATLVGDVSNSGIINSTASGNVVNLAIASVDGGNINSNYAYAYAYGRGVDASANGFVLDSYLVDGNVNNTGAVTADAAAELSNTADADSNYYAYAYAYGSGNVAAYGVDINVSTIAGDVFNSGHISVDASANISNNVTATATSGNIENTSSRYAYAYAYGNVAGQAVGLGVYATSISGDVTNTGNIDANLDLSAHNDAFATGAANGNVGGNVYAGATSLVRGNVAGVQVSVTEIRGDIYNSGNVTVDSAVLSDNSATAKGGAGNIAAWASGDALTVAYGLDLTPSLVGSVTNEGAVDVSASARNFNSASATGISGNVDSYTSGAAYAYAYGINVQVDSVFGDVTNHGDISVAAFANVSNDSTSISSGNADASATADGGGKGQYSAAYAIGLNAEIGQSFTGSFTNTGDISANAIALTFNAANVSAESGAAYALAYGSAGASATGLAFDVGHSGTVTNSGDISILAVAAEQNRATASGQEAGNVYAQAYGAAGAYALGATFDVHAISGNVVNGGDINAFALSLSDNQATALGNLAGSADASADGRADSSATGLSLYSSSIAGDVTNSGDVFLVSGALSLNSAQASSNAAANIHADVYGFASADATGLNLNVDTILGNVSNTGDITVIALAYTGNEASASGNVYDSSGAGATAYGDAYAHATGLSLAGNSLFSTSLNGDFTNNGDINAMAFAGAHNSVNVISSGNLNGGVSASAGGDVSADATALYVRAYTIGTNSSFGGNFVNHGDISANVIASSVNSVFVSGNVNGDTAAHINGNVDAAAYGVWVSAESLNGSLTNTGNINVSASATANNSANVGVGNDRVTLQDGGNVDAVVQGNVSAVATGLGIQISSIGGDVRNTGNINAHAAVNATNSATVFSTNSGNVASNVSASALGGGGQVHRRFTDEDSLSANHAKAVGLYAQLYNASTDSVFNVVSGNGTYHVSYSQTGSLAGNFDNSGTITATAAVDSDNTASATGYGNVHALATGSAYSIAYGIELRAVSIGGNVVNSGAITAIATASTDTDATATSTGNISNTTTAFADGGESVAIAVGLYAKLYGYNANYIAYYQSGTQTDSRYNTDGGHGGVGGNFDNSGALTVTAQSQSVNDADATSIAFANGVATGDSYATAYGLALQTLSLGGNIINSGDMNVLATANVQNSADASGFVAHATAEGNGEADSGGLSASLDSLGRNFTNSGNITAHSVGLLSNSATASGVFETVAHAQGGMIAHAKGVNLGAENVGGNILNSGDLTITAVAMSTNAAAASGNITHTADVFAYGYAYADATGLDFYAYSFGGDITNNGNIATTASAGSRNSANVTGSTWTTGNVDAAVRGNVSASASGLYVSANAISGDITNRGAISANVIAQTTNSIFVTGNVNGNVNAYIHGNVEAYAGGVYVSANSIAGSLKNTGNIDISASAIADNSANISVAKNLNSGDNGGNVYGLVYGNVSSVATGFAIRGTSIGGDVTNTGNISVSATVNATNSATVFSTNTGNINNDVVAGAFGGDGGIHPASPEELHTANYAKAVGLYGNVYGNTYSEHYSGGSEWEYVETYGSGGIAGNFDNSGAITVNARVDLDNKATASGFGNVLAVATGSAYSVAYGIELRTASVGGNVVNSGDITATAVTINDNTAKATGSVTGNVEGNITAVANGGPTVARAVGIYAELYGYNSVYTVMYSTGAGTQAHYSESYGGGIGNNFDNSGDLTITAQSQSVNDADATSLFYASADADGQTYAAAYGLVLRAVSVGGNITNSGDMDILATANLVNEATASGIIAQAGAQGGGNAYAVGLAVLSDNVDRDITNRGNISVQVVGKVSNSATATGINVGAQSMGYEFATARGVTLSVDSVGGNVLNTGDLTVTAVAMINNTATASGNVEFSSPAYAAANGGAIAGAYGLSFNGDSLNGNFDNSGSVDVGAHAQAVNSAVATGAYYSLADAIGQVHSEAVGLSLYADSIGGDVTNSGDITVNASGNISNTATANGSAAYYAKAQAIDYSESVYAKGFYASAYSLDGNFDNGGNVIVHASAEAENDATAVGTGNVQAFAQGNAYAQAYGVSFHSASLGGDLTNGGDLTVTAMAVVTNTASAGGNVADEATALSGGGVGAKAVGLYGNVYGRVDYDSYYNTAYGGHESTDTYYQYGSIGGSFSNSGDIITAASAASHNDATAVGGNVAAIIGSGAYAVAYGIELRTVSVGGNVINSGDITVSASADNDGTALASSVIDGNVDALAVASGGARASAVGLYAEIYGYSTHYSEYQHYANVSGNVTLTGSNYSYNYAYGGGIGDNFKNSGTISVSAIVNSVNEATSIADEYSAAYAYGNATANADDIVLNAYSVGGDVLNSGNLTATAVAHTTNTAAADGDASDRGIARANGNYTYGDASGFYADLYSVGGNFNNSGDITVRGTVTSKNKATASSIDDAYAAAYGYGYASASGITLYADSIAGDVINSGRITATANAALTNIATATIADGDGSNQAKARAYGNNAGAEAEGFYVNGNIVGGDLTNSGRISASATSGSKNTATAESSDYAYALASGGAYASAYALELRVDTLLGNVTNSGALTASAVAATTNNATAHDDIGGARAYAYGYSGDAEAYGIYSSGAVEGHFGNSGAINASAIAGSINAAAATAITAVALGYAAGCVSATAYGIRATGNLLGNGFGNSGIITANASGRTENVSMTTATNDLAESRARANADATGAAIYLTYDNVYGDITNSGALNAAASLREHNLASAHGAKGASANVSGYAEASAWGLWASGNVADGSITNSGAVTVLASVNMLNESVAASAAGNVTADSGDSYAAATAYGVGEEFSSLTGSFTNSGRLNVAATASNQSKARATGPNAVATAYSVAYAAAYGMAAWGDSIGGGVANSGAMNVLAQATAISTAVAVGPVHHAPAYAEANALAEGIYSGADYVGGNVTNSGALAITAIAKAKEIGDSTAIAYAEAVGIHLDGTFINGQLTNSGAINVVATGISAYATGISLDNGAIVNGGIYNTGAITAKATGTKKQANAYNIEGEGAGTVVNQLGGAITGDIRMKNEYADNFRLSGGSVTGNTYGNSTDVFDIFTGANNTFTYTGNIDGVGNINVNTVATASTPVRFNMSGNTTHITNINVNTNGTLNVGVNSTMNTVNYNQAGNSTVLWQLSPGINGKIVTTNVKLASGAQSAANLSAGLFGLDQSFTVIDSTNAPTGAFSSFTYTGTSLYNVTASWMPGNDYVVHVVRIPLTSIPTLTPDGQAAAEGIDKIISSLDPNSPLGQILGRVLILPPEQYAAAMKAIAGQQNADMAIAGANQLTSLLDIIFSQINGGSGSGGFAGLDTNIRVADNNIKTVMNDAGPQYTVGGSATGSALAAWVRGFGNWTSLDGNSRGPGFDSSGGGVVAGLDYEATEDLLVGLAGGYQVDDLDFNGTGSGKVKSWTIAGYGKLTLGKFYLDAVAGYASQDYNMVRNFTVAGTPFAARRNNDGDTIQLSGEAGYDFDFSDGSIIEPFLAFTWGRTNIDGTIETGAGPLNLALADETLDSARTKIGGRWSKTFHGSDIGGISWTPTVELAWRHEFADANASQASAIGGFPASSFQVTGTTAPRDAAAVGVGVGVKFSDSVDAALQYKGEFSSGFNSNTGMMRVRLHF